jgi:hypothetical protein
MKSEGVRWVSRINRREKSSRRILRGRVRLGVNSCMLDTVREGA